MEWLSEGWYICHNKQMQLWHVTFATNSFIVIKLLVGKVGEFWWETRLSLQTRESGWVKPVLPG